MKARIGISDPYRCGVESCLLTWKPIWVFYPDAMYLPVFDTLITEMSLSCP